MINTLAGGSPELIKRVEVVADEFCHILYMPVYMFSEGYRIPARLLPYADLIHAVPNKYTYIYISIRHGTCVANTYANRPGWHVDGYMSDDENYIWASSEPTEYLDHREIVGPEDHDDALRMFDNLDGSVITLKSNELYRLGKTIHRSPLIRENGIRTFVKLSCSDEKYNLKGNAINELFDYHWSYEERSMKRNHPAK